MMLKTNDKLISIYNKVKLVFMCFMVIYVAVREVMPLHFLISSPLLSAAIFAAAFMLILAGLFLSGTCFADRRTDALFLFLAATVLSCILKIKYGYADNIKALGAMVMFYFLFFDSGINISRERRKYETDCITGTLCAVWALFALMSVMMFFLSIYYKVDSGRWITSGQGFDEKLVRLSGVFQDCNYAGYVSDVVIFSSVRFIANRRKPAVTVLNILNILLQLSFLTLAGSRSATLILLLAVVIFVFYTALSKSGEKINVMKTVRSLAVSALCSALVYGIILSGQYVLPYARSVVDILPESIPTAITEMYNGLYSVSDLEITKTKNAYGQSSTGKKKHSTSPIKRTDLQSEEKAGDVSNGRFRRWKQTIKLFKFSPATGTSPRNVSSFAKKVYPKSLMAKYNMAPHNGYLDILVGTGVVGAAVFLLFLLPAIIALLKKYFRFEKDGDFIIAAVSVFIMAASAMFVSDLFFMISIGAFVFWTFFGYALHTEGAVYKKGILMRIYEKIFRRKDA